MRTFFGVEIPKKNTKCSKMNEDILPGDEIYSVLKSLDDDYIREDYCLTCWNSIQKELEESVVLNWKSVVSKKKQEKELFLNKDQKILSLFNQLAVSETLFDQQQAFILSLYLLRKKQIYNRKEFLDSSGQPMTLFEVAATEENLIVKKFEFSELDLPSIQKSIVQKMDSNIFK